jgi:hypothetical protein
MDADRDLAKAREGLRHQGWENEEHQQLIMRGTSQETREGIRNQGWGNQEQCDQEREQLLVRWKCSKW